MTSTNYAHIYTSVNSVFINTFSTKYTGRWEANKWQTIVSLVYTWNEQIKKGKESMFSHTRFVDNGWICHDGSVHLVNSYRSSFFFLRLPLLFFFCVCFERERERKCASSFKSCFRSIRSFVLFWVLCSSSYRALHLSVLKTMPTKWYTPQ